MAEQFSKAEVKAPEITAKKEVYKSNFNSLTKNIINKIYKKNYVEGKFQEQNFENFNINSENEMAVKVAKDYTDKSIERMQNDGLIITG